LLRPHSELWYDEASDAMVHLFNFQFPWWFKGTHNLTVEWMDGNAVDLRISINVTFQPGLNYRSGPLHGANDSRWR
jgi:hypothetical protein